MIRRIAVVASVLALAASFACGSGDEDAAIAAAEQWLTLIDAGEYAKGYTESSAWFRKGVTQEKFTDVIPRARAPLGRLVSRKVRTAQSARTLPNTPRGEYVVIQYDSVFEKQRAAVETVTEMLENGQWKVAGYRIR